MIKWLIFVSRGDFVFLYPFTKFIYFLRSSAPTASFRPQREKFKDCRTYILPMDLPFLRLWNDSHRRNGDLSFWCAITFVLRTYYILRTSQICSMPIKSYFVLDFLLEKESCGFDIYTSQWSYSLFDINLLYYFNT